MTTEELHEIIEQIKNIKFHLQTLTMINTCEVAKQSCIPAGKSCFWAGATAKMKAVFIERVEKCSAKSTSRYWN